jgi:16S rRNA (cytosine1402-N4)-methyltransferase
MKSLNMSPQIHTPVLLEETVRALAVQPGGRYIDCTLGTGGHAVAILEAGSPGGQLLGIDADPQALAVARERLADYRNSVLLVNANFADLQSICFRYDFYPVHGILFDLGLSSLQLDDDSRGFSFQKDAPLDMRLNPEQTTTAADIVNTLSESELARLIKTYGQEGGGRRIAHQVAMERPIKSTRQLVRVVEKAASQKRGRIHPATKTFQALRIAVNEELEHLEMALRQAVDLLGFEGRLAVISYHSLEDRIVKQFMHQESRDCICPPGTPSCVCGHRARLRLINKKIITPTPSEVKLNPRSRSARLRVAAKYAASSEYDSAAEKLCFSMAGEGGVWRRPAMLRKLRQAFLAS